jgi:hypothetical protein
MIDGIRRRVVGPDTNSPPHVRWPGEAQNPVVVGPGYTQAISYPIGPFVGVNGEEVVFGFPLVDYSVGVLTPMMTDAAAEGAGEAADGDDNDNEEQVIIDGGNGLVDTDDIDGAADIADDDEEVAAHEDLVMSGQQSIGLSLRVPATVELLQVTLEGGAYTRFDVAGQGRKPWWLRSDVALTAEFPTSEDSNRSFTHGSLAIDIGVRVNTDVDGTRVCTVWVRNTGEAKTFPEANEKALFQTRLAVLARDLLPYEPFLDRQLDSLDLLYGNVHLFSVGHGCDSVVESGENGHTVKSVSLPVVNVKGVTPDVSADGRRLHVGMLDLAEMNNDAVEGVDRMITAYGSWIEQQTARIPALPTPLQPIATRHMQECRRYLGDIAEGWALVNSDVEVRTCLMDASRAMNAQRVGYQADPRTVETNNNGGFTVSGMSPHAVASPQSQWRPFQVAFILASLPKTVDAEHPGRNETDVIWMPTGGGKTEAYLGLSAFVILREKQQQTKSGNPRVRNTKVFMRYTLRLLTVQQLTRAASLICALEVLRREKVSTYGTEEIRIGAWLGAKVTPNRRKDALELLDEAEKKGKDAPFIVKKCPWCGAAMGTHHKDATVKNRHVIAGYRSSAAGNALRVLMSCPDAACPFSFHTVRGNNGATLERGIPVFDVDEDVYAAKPDFVVGTIDKVARMAWRPESQQLFGLQGGSRKAPPPTLFIQDELHLISGPLGSIDGVFEVMLEHLCLADGGTAPVYVAATATTKNYQDQITKLYARGSRVVPPPALTIDDSFFAKKDEESPGKTYVAVSSANFTGAAKLQTTVLATLAHQAPAFEPVGADPDPYWSNVVFFSSRRALGLLTSAVHTTLQSQMKKMYQLSGTKTGPVGKDGKKANSRYINRARELTATSSEDVGEVLNALSVPMHRGESVDLCFATSMVEVGLDVPRLGLMTVITQPKSASQYIQVTGRVGRSGTAPGLVVVVLNPRVARDLAHYEGFTAWHQRLYASVESASVTPFTGRALDKSVPSVLTALCRILGGNSASPSVQVGAYGQTAVSALQARATTLGQAAIANLARVTRALLTIARQPAVAEMKWTREDGGAGKPFGYAVGRVPTDRAGAPHWQILNSMRSVDQDANIKAMATAPGPGGPVAGPGGGGGGPAGGDGGDEL